MRPRRSRHKGGKHIGDIILTPLIDTTFLLLITFIITFPFVQMGIPVNLPTGTADNLPTDRNRSITLDLKGRIFLDDVECSEQKLAAEMSDLSRKSPQTTVLVRADEGLAYGKVVKVLRILHEAKVTRMALVTRMDKAKS